MKNHAVCGLCAAACAAACAPVCGKVCSTPQQANCSAQAASFYMRRAQSLLCSHFNAARKWNCWEFHCAISINAERVEILVCSTRCGLQPAAKYEPALRVLLRPIIIRVFVVCSYFIEDIFIFITNSLRKRQVWFCRFIFIRTFIWCRVFVTDVLFAVAFGAVTIRQNNTKH